MRIRKKSDGLLHLCLINPRSASSVLLQRLLDGFDVLLNALLDIGHHALKLLETTEHFG